MKNSKLYVLPMKENKCLKIVHLRRPKKRYAIISPSFISAMEKKKQEEIKMDDLRKLLPCSEDLDTASVLAAAVSKIKTLKQQVLEMFELVQQQNQAFQKMLVTPLNLLPMGMFPTANGVANGTETGRRLGVSFSPSWLEVVNMQIAVGFAKIMRQMPQPQLCGAQTSPAAPASAMAPTTPDLPSTDDQEPLPES